MNYNYNTMVKEFKGHCKGIRLTKRSVNDNHICIQIITEDDDNWFASANPFSSHWINELIEQLEITKAYLETQDPDITEGIQYGWKFVNDTF